MREIKLSRGYVTYVDADDFAWLMEYTWHTRKKDNESGRERLRERVEAATTFRVDLPNGMYAFCPITMHRLIMEAKPDQMVDHIDGDPLNNQRSNLRFVTNQQNAWNARGAKSFMGKPTTSRFKGVFKKTCKYKGEPRYEYYVGRIRLNDKDVTLYHGKDEIEAACRYDMAAQRHFGEYARLNFDGATYDKWYNETYGATQCVPD